MCGQSHQNVGGISVTDYSPHHEPFQYYESTSNPKHLPPSSAATRSVRPTRPTTSTTRPTSTHALAAGSMPAVSFLKAPAYQDGHAANSDPIDEQRFVVEEINKIQQSPDWDSTAIVLAYDDSDGWYDHVNADRQRLERPDAGLGHLHRGRRSAAGRRTPTAVVTARACRSR